MQDLDSPLLDLGGLRCFVVAADHGSLSAAATALGIAQSALSRKVSQLESLLGARLFHRTGRGVAPTEAGACILPRARVMLETAHELAADARAQPSRPTGTVTLAVLPGLSRLLAARVLRRLLLTYPDIRLKTVEAYSGEVENLLADGGADLGIFNRYRPIRSEKGQAILCAPLHLVGRADATVLGRGAIQAAALEGLPLVLPVRPNGMRSYLDEVCTQRGLRLNVVCEASSGTLIREVVLHCDVYSLLPPHAVAEEISAGTLAMAPLQDLELKQYTFVEATRKRPLALASRAVWQIILQELQALNGPAGDLPDQP